MPPAMRNQRNPTGGDAPTFIAASSIERPSEINAQNRRRCSRHATRGRPGDRSLSRSARSERHRPAIAPPSMPVLRRTIESNQYVSIRYTERLAEAGIEPSVGSVGVSYDNALAETINGHYKAEVIHRLAQIGLRPSLSGTPHRLTTPRSIHPRAARPARANGAPPAPLPTLSPRPPRRQDPGPVGSPGTHRHS